MDAKEIETSDAGEGVMELRELRVHADRRGMMDDTVRCGTTSASCVVDLTVNREVRVGKAFDDVKRYYL